MALATASILAPLAVSAPASSAPAAAAVFPPWWSGAQVLTAADAAGDVLSVGAAPFIVTVQNKSRPVGRELRASGALLLLLADPEAACNP